MVGLLRFPDTLTRLHALTTADNLRLRLVVLGLRRLSVPEYTDARMKDYEGADSNKDGALTRNETEGK